jgi:hypothetical protein
MIKDGRRKGKWREDNLFLKLHSLFWSLFFFFFPFGFAQRVQQNRNVCNETAPAAEESAQRAPLRLCQLLVTDLAVVTCQDGARPTALARICHEDNPNT